MFGYHKVEMERSNLSILLPSPISEYHDGFLRKYAELGQGELMNTTKDLFALNKSGFLFPICLTLREVPGKQFGMEDSVAFLGIIQPQQHLKLDLFFVVDGKDRHISCWSANVPKILSVFKQELTGMSIKVDVSFPFYIFG